MLQSISIKNFKGYEDFNKFDFNGLTYLTGANNSGKSTLIQALFLLASSNSNNFEPTLLLNTPIYKFGKYSDILNRNCRNEDNLEFFLEFNDSKLFLQYSINENIYNNPILKKMELNLTSSKKNKSTVETLEFNLIKDKSIDYTSFKTKELYEIKYLKDGKIRPLGPAFIDGFSFTNLPFKKDKVKSFDYLNTMFFFRRISYLFNLRNVKYLKAYREEAKQLYDLQGTSLQNIGVSGEYCAEVLYKNFQNNTKVTFGKQEEDFSKLFAEWFKRIVGTSYNLNVETLDSFYKIKITEDLIKNQSYDITQVGFGFSQIVPIITMILLSHEDDVLLIENPEVHLHPKLQANLADLFMFAVKNGRKLIVETHSEHIINRTRLKIKQDEIKDIERKVNIYFFEKRFEDNDSYIRYEQININKDGKISHWPKNFFDQSYEDSIGLIKNG